MAVLKCRIILCVQLKMWVERGKEEEAAKASQLAPPPTITTVGTFEQNKPGNRCGRSCSVPVEGALTFYPPPIQQSY